MLGVAIARKMILQYIENIHHMAYQPEWPHISPRAEGIDFQLKGENL
jgi:hypothetical protein